MSTRRLRAGRIELALRCLSERAGPPLLLLHELFGSSLDWNDDRAWPGPVYGLDFSGHGASDWVPGGGYYPETFAGEADRALQEIGPAHVVGAGAGAYVALLLAGARPSEVRGALLLPGRGLNGDGPVPDWNDIVGRTDDVLATCESRDRDDTSTDPMVAMAETDIRPLPYARAYAERAAGLALARLHAPAPPWWKEIQSLPNVHSLAADRSPLAMAAGAFAPAGAHP